MLALRNKFGKNAVLKAANLKEEARTIARNSEIGGHKA
jgi:DNA polymerase V